jgi:hypothetical protein
MGEKPPADDQGLTNEKAEELRQAILNKIIDIALEHKQQSQTPPEEGGSNG